jgi:iron complex transport system ATP-binding protein
VTRLRYHRLWVERGRRTLLRDVNLVLEPGQLVALVGPNGSGKTTLLRVALGLLVPSRGAVTVDDVDVHRLDPRERAAHLAWLPQILVHNEPITVHEAVTTGRYRFGESAQLSRAAASKALERLDAAHLADRNVLALSGGERQRVALATLLAQQSPLILLDEPANHLDPTQQIETYTLIGKLWQEGLGVLLVTHDVNLLAGLPNHDAVQVVGLREGTVALDSTLAAPALADELSALFGMTMRSLEHAGRRVIVPWPRLEEAE